MCHLFVVGPSSFSYSIQSCQQWQCYHQRKKVISSGPQADDHWIKSLMLIFLTQCGIIVLGIFETDFVRAPLLVLDLDDSPRINRKLLNKNVLQQDGTTPWTRTEPPRPDLDRIPIDPDGTSSTQMEPPKSRHNHRTKTEPPVDRKTPVKTLPCRKLRLQAVMII